MQRITIYVDQTPVGCIEHQSGAYPVSLATMIPEEAFFGDNYTHAIDVPSI